MLILILIGDCLNDEAEKNKHPYPVGTSEASRVEEREGSEEATTKDDQRSKGKLPLTTYGVDEELALQLLLTDAKEERLTALYEEQEDE